MPNRFSYSPRIKKKSLPILIRTFCISFGKGTKALLLREERVDSFTKGGRVLQIAHFESKFSLCVLKDKMKNKIFGNQSKVVKGSRKCPRIQWQ